MNRACDRPDELYFSLLHFRIVSVFSRKTWRSEIRDATSLRMTVGQETFLLGHAHWLHTFRAIEIIAALLPLVVATGCLPATLASSEKRSHKPRAKTHARVLTRKIR